MFSIWFDWLIAGMVAALWVLVAAGPTFSEYGLRYLTWLLLRGGLPVVDRQLVTFFCFAKIK